MTFAPSYALLTDLGELRQLADRVISEGKPFGYDIETGYEGESREKAAVHPEENFVAGISFTNSLTWARYVPLRHDSGTNADNAAAAVIFWEMLTAAGEDGQPLGVAHHAKFELRVLARWFLRNLALHPRLGPAVIAALGYTPIRSCTMLESYAEGENRTHGLKDITVWTFGHFMTEILDLFPQGLTKAQQKSIRFNSLDQHDPKVVNYACEDALWALAHHLHRYPRVKDTFIYQVEMGVLREAACLMEDTGLDYDWGRMREGGIAGREFSGKYLAEVRRDFEEWLGRPLDPQFNFGSSQQLAWLLYGAHDKLVSRWGGGLGLAVTRKTKTGNPSTEAKTALKELSGQHPPVQKLLNYKALLKLVRDFLEKFEAKYSFAADGRAHPSLLQHGTVTGRTSKNDPNDQQCLPGTYEVLTPGGWVRLQDLADGVPVAEYLDDETIWFTVPSQVTRDQYAGEMVELRSVEGGDWQYTPNHRIVYRKRRKSRRRDAEDSPVMEMPAAQWAAELEARPPMFADGRRMLNDLKYIRAGFKDSGRFMLPRSQAFMHLAIACQAEGHRRTDGQGGTAWYDVELRSARKQAQFAQIVQACGLEFKQTSRSRRCRVPGSMVAQWLDESKNFRPETVLDLHASGLRDFVRTVLEWDGDFTRGCTYGQKNCRRQSVEVVQAAAVLCGFTTSIYERPEYDAVTVNLHDKTVKYAGAQQAARVPSPGMVYCVTVPSGMFLARNPQGKVMVTGNSPKKYKYALATGETFEHSFRDNIRAPRPGMRLWWQILLEELGAWSPAPEDDLGWYILGFDWSMIELRVMAGESGETALIEAFRRGDDLHNLTAGRMLGKPPEQVTDDERTKYGKTFNFGISYGMEAKGIADRLGCPAAQAEELLAQFWAAYPRLRQWREKVVADSFRNGYVTTHFGRKVKIWEYEDAEMLSGWAARSRRSAGERTAGNAPIQGAAAGDYKKVTMVRAQRALKAAGLAGKVLLAMDIHDELEWYVRKDVAPADVIRVLRPHVEWDAGCCPDCRGWPPMVAEWHVGERWGSLIKLEILPDGDVRARGKAETAVAAPDEDPGGDDEDEAAREGMPAAWPSGGYPGNRAPAGAGALAGSNPAPPGPPPPPRPAPPPARPVPQVPRTVVVSLQRMPQQEQVQRFMSLLAGCPGPNTVIVRVPQGDIPVAGTSGLAPDSGAEVAVIFGGAITYYDLDSVDMAGLAAGLDL